MAEQLILVDPNSSSSRLDEHTREVGRRGVAEARRILTELVENGRDAGGLLRRGDAAA